MLDLEHLKETRQKKGLTQMKIAKGVGVSLNAYIRWENGVAKPTEENLEKLENILK